MTKAVAMQKPSVTFYKSDEEKPGFSSLNFVWIAVYGIWILQMCS